ncbi:MAG: DsrE family protein [Candidatus Limnocylindrales bacterium]
MGAKILAWARRLFVTGTEGSHNALRLALALTKVEGTEVRVFLMGDAVGCAKRDQRTPEGCYNHEMLKGLTAKAIPIGACDTCLDARGYTEAEMVDGVHRSSMAELPAWTQERERVLVF